MFPAAWRSTPKLLLVAQIASIIVLGIGSLIFLGWLEDRTSIQNIFPGMSPVTAFSFILVSAALWLLILQKALAIAQAFAGVAVLIGILKVGANIFSIDIGIHEQVLVTSLANQVNLFPLNSALTFILIGIALLLYNSPRISRVKIGQVYLLITVMIALIPLLDDLYANALLAPSPRQPYMSLTSSLLFLALCLGALFAQFDRGLTAVITYNTVGGTTARRLLPAAILLPILLDEVRLLGRRAGLFSAEVGIALFVMLVVVAFVCIIWWNAELMNVADQERKRIEADLRGSNTRYRALFEYSSDAIVVLSEQGHYLEVNSQLERLTGYTRSELLQMKLGGLSPSEDFPESSQAFKGITEENIWSDDGVVLRKDGSKIIVDFSVVLIGEGLYQAILHDISERKKVEDNLRKSLEQERELNELKSRFVSMVSHDFRTPLAVIQSSTDLLLTYADRMEPAKRQDRLEKIQFQIGRLVQMLDNILIIGKAERVGLEFRAEHQNVAEFCAALVAELQFATPTHSIVFNNSGDCTDVVFDPKLLHQAFTNLISNAVKYSPADEPVVVDLACGEAEILVRVQDHGIGIPEEDQKHLFELFHRAQNVGNISGTGLGLSIVKQAIDAHHGTIQVESLPNLGTIFTIRLPRSQSA